MVIEFATIPNLRLRLQTDVAGLSYAYAFGGLGGLLALPLTAIADRCVDCRMRSRSVVLVVCSPYH